MQVLKCYDLLVAEAKAGAVQDPTSKNRLWAALREALREWACEIMPAEAATPLSESLESQLLEIFDELDEHELTRLLAEAAGYFDLLTGLQVQILDELIRRRHFWRREKRRLINVFRETFNYVEDMRIQGLKIGEFLDDLERTSSRLRRVAFQARFLCGYTLQDIADGLGVGLGSVRYQLEEALKHFHKQRGKFF